MLPCIQWDLDENGRLYASRQPAAGGAMRGMTRLDGAPPGAVLDRPALSGREAGHERAAATPSAV